MKQPKYTDSHKFPHGYVPAAATDISKTFARIAEQAKPKQELSVVRIKGRKS